MKNKYLLNKKIMHLNKQSLQQINDEYIESLPAESLRELCKRAESDLKEAHERLTAI
ncbi:MAG: hypothetical protein GY862_02275, partial [Gammaproteobacteria bacterium]|nr:hypothetical protein [Gammaproteobacteria bacterium]